MNKIRLYIEDEELEMVDEIQFAINKQFEDINNPTSIINDYSKTVRIPFSQKNDEVFGKIYSPDRLIIAGAGTIGITFDPYKKLDFKLLWNNELLMSGYAKMLNISRENGKGFYEVSLNGELGKLFQEFKKITFVYNNDTSNYYIDTREYFEEEMNRNLIYNCWNTGGQQTMNLEKQYMWAINPSTGERVKIKNPDYRFTDICGFTPSNTYDDDFDYKTIQRTINTTKEIKDILELVNFESYTGFSAETVVGDGLMPRQVGEFRSYYQQPFIYFNKLFKMFREKAEQISGYTFDLDSVWFNNENPYWRNLTMILNKLDVNLTKSKQNYNNNYKLQNGNNAVAQTWAPTDDYSADKLNYLVPKQILSEDVSICCDLNTVPRNMRYWTMPDKVNGLIYRINIPFYVSTDLTTPSTNIKDDNALRIDIETMYGDADSSYGIKAPVTSLYNKFIIVSPTSTVDLTPYSDCIKIVLDKVDITGQTVSWTLSLPVDVYVCGAADRIKMQTNVRWINNDYPLNF